MVPVSAHACRKNVPKMSHVKLGDGESITLQRDVSTHSIV